MFSVGRHQDAAGLAEPESRAKGEFSFVVLLSLFLTLDFNQIRPTDKSIM